MVGVIQVYRKTVLGKFRIMFGGKGEPMAGGGKGSQNELRASRAAGFTE